MHQFHTIALMTMLSFLSTVGCRTHATSDDSIRTSNRTIEILSPIDGDTYIEDEAIPFRFLLSDNEKVDESLLVSLNSSIDGALENQIEWSEANGFYEGSFTLSVGEHMVTYSIEGFESFDVVNLVVLPNAAPSCGMIDPINGVSIEEQPVLFVGEFSDVDNIYTDLNIRWSSSLQDDVWTMTGNPLGQTEWYTDSLVLGTHEIVLTITDPHGKSCRDSVQHLVISESDRGQYDLDGDGLIGDDDCDDDNPVVLNGPNGAAEQCPGSSCLDILTDGYSQGDGLYWVLDENGSTNQVYCDMTTYDGGWSLCGSMSESDVGVAYGFENVGDPSVSTMYSRYCVDSLHNIGTEILATFSNLNEIQVWLVTESYLRGVDGRSVVPAVTPLFDSRGVYSESVAHGVCNFGNCVDSINGYTIGTKIGTMLNGNYHAFGLGAHCDQECNEALVWYNEVVSGRVNFFVR